MFQQLLSICYSIGILVCAATLPAKNIVSANNPAIEYCGRFDITNPARPAFAWPGACIIANFTGTSLGVILHETADSDGYAVYIDGSLATRLTTSSAIDTFQIISGLTDATHSLTFVKRTESVGAPVTFLGFVLDAGRTLLRPPARPSRKIEFIGDSHTAGLGNATVADWQLIGNSFFREQISA